jgi:hypothetical protein
LAAQQAAPVAGRRVAVEPYGETFEAAWQAVEAALVASDAPIDSLDIDASAAPFGDEGVRRLLERHPGLTPTKLTLSSAKITPQGLGTLLASAVPSRLQLLDLRDNYLGAPGARLLAESVRLGSLRELNLGRNHLHARGAAALGGARGLSSVTRLELEYNFIGPEGALALAKSAPLRNLHDLGLAYNFLGDSGAGHIASGSWPALELVDVGCNEIGTPGAKALATSTTLPPQAIIGFGFNLEDVQLKQLGLEQRLKVGPYPERAERVTLGQEDAFDHSKRPASKAAAPPPEDLPASIEFRELWIWEFGLVVEFPIFMLPDRRPGNGKSRSFSWLDRASLAIGGYWLQPGQTLAEALAAWTRAEPGEQVQVERRNARTVIVRSSRGGKKRALRVQSAYGALFYVDFTYAADLEPYFAPLAERALQSLYFDRAHLKK